MLRVIILAKRKKKTAIYCAFERCTVHIYENRGKNFDCFTSTNINYFPHLHNQFELLYVCDGQLSIISGAKEYALKQGDIYVVFPNHIHEYKTEKESKCIFWIFNCDTLPDFAEVFRTKMAEKPFVNIEKMHVDVKNCISEFIQREELKTENILSKSFLNIMLTHILPELNLQDIELRGDLDWMQKALLFINANYTQSINLQNVAHHIGISKYYLSRSFQQNVGCSLPYYVNTLRANYAVQLLRTTDYSVTQIVHECGFESQTTFFRVFRKLGMKSPKLYRKVML